MIWSSLSSVFTLIWTNKGKRWRFCVNELKKKREKKIHTNTHALRTLHTHWTIIRGGRDGMKRKWARWWMKQKWKRHWVHCLLCSLCARAKQNIYIHNIYIHTFIAAWDLHGFHCVLTTAFVRWNGFVQEDKEGTWRVTIQENIRQRNADNVDYQWKHEHVWQNWCKIPDHDEGGGSNAGQLKQSKNIAKQ